MVCRVFVVRCVLFVDCWCLVRDCCLLLFVVCCLFGLCCLLFVGVCCLLSFDGCVCLLIVVR